MPKTNAEMNKAVDWQLETILQFMTREVFDTLIIVIILIGLALAARRLYSDFTRPLPPASPLPDDETHPRRP